LGRHARSRLYLFFTYWANYYTSHVFSIAKIGRFVKLK
jgi:hypothetical protein